MRFIMMLLAVISLVSCGDNSKLARSKAEDVIQKYPQFNSATERISKKEVNLVWDGAEHSGMFDGKLDLLLASLAKRGLLAFSRQGGMIPEFKITLSEHGDALTVNDPESKGRWYTVKVCDRKVVEVTGITQPTPQSAEVTFTYKADKPTSFGETTPKACSAAVKTGVAELRLFDDGWRVSQIASQSEEGYSRWHFKAN